MTTQLPYKEKASQRLLISEAFSYLSVAKTLKTMQDNEEIWKDVIDYEGLYQISNLGRVKSFPRNTTRGCILKSHPNPNGYLCVHLTKNGKQTNFRVHKMVAVAFLGHIQNGYQEVIDHINGIVTDNQVSNLRVVSQRINTSCSRRKKTSQYVGVCWNRFENKWMAYIGFKNKNHTLGLYSNEEEAHNAYVSALSEIELNKSNPDYTIPPKQRKQPSENDLCRRGHKMTSNNTYYHEKFGVIYRQCRACRRLRRKAINNVKK